jgi:hypothetical protein
VNRYHPLFLVTVIILNAAVNHVAVGRDADVSPALLDYPHGILETHRHCAVAAGAGAQAADHVVAWFEAFRRHSFDRVMDPLRASASGGSAHALAESERIVLDVRRLADFRSEQALIAVIDASIRRLGNRRQDCVDNASMLILRIAAQRDRAWAWAEAMDSVLAMNREQMETMSSRRTLDQSLRKLEEAYRQLEAYRTGTGNRGS